MASFDSTQAAVECARAIQKSFERYNQASPEPIHIRIDLDCGEPIEDSHDLFGSTVQRASRMCSGADTDQILVSNMIRLECQNQYGFADCGCRSLKGFRQLVQVFECKWRGESSE
jgi:class 3 adenylate cyclase